MAKGAKKPEVKLQWLRLQWWQALLMWSFWPLMLLGTLYVLVFFFLNSTPCRRIVEAQLNAMMKGEFEIAKLSVGPQLDLIELRGVKVKEPEGDQVLALDSVVLEFAPESLLSILTRNQLTLQKLSVKEADILLDFSGSNSFNLLRALEMEEQDESESDFTLVVKEIEILRTHVRLVFERFSLDFDEANLRGLSLSVGQGLTMTTRPSAFGDYGLKVNRGKAIFDPGMFGMVQGMRGHPKNGALFDGGGGRAAQLGKIFQLSARHLQNHLSSQGDYPQSPTRGPLVVPLAQLNLTDFWWRGMSYGARSLTGRVSGAQLALTQSWMNLSPTAADIQNLEDQYGVSPSGVPPEESTLYRAAMDLKLPANDPLLSYFLGDRIHSHDNLDLSAELFGDFNHAEGNLSLVTDRVQFEDYQAYEVKISALLDGEQVQLLDAGMRAFGGQITASGEYYLMRGDFDFEVALGELDSELGFQRTQGLDPSLLAPELAQYAGDLVGHFALSQRGPELNLTLLEAVDLWLVEPLPNTDIQQIMLRQESDAGEPLVAMRNRVIYLLDGLRVEAGHDQVKIAKGITYWLDAERFDGLDLKLRLRNLDDYVEGLNLGIDAQNLALDLQASGAILNPNAHIDLRLEAGGYEALPELSLDSLELVAKYNGRRVSISRLEGQTNLGDFSVRGWVEPFKGALNKVRSNIPMNLELGVTGVKLELIPWIADYRLRGALQLEAKVKGTSQNPEVHASVDARSLSGFGESVPSLVSRFSFENGLVEVQDFVAEYQPLLEGDQRVAVRVAHAAYDLNSEDFELSLELDPLPLHGIPSLAKAELELAGWVQAELSAVGNVQGLLGAKQGQLPLRLDGHLSAQALSYGKRALGDLDLNWTSDKKGVRVQGELFDLFELKGFAPMERPLQAAVELSFQDLDILEVAPELDQAVNGDPNQAHKPKLQELVVSGAVRASYHEADGPRIELELEELGSRFMGQGITNHEPILIGYAPNRGEVELERFELVIADKHLILWGKAGLDGKLQLELNGEINMVLAQLLGVIGEASGSLALAISVEGDILDGDKLDLDAVHFGGFVAVREPIQLLIRGLTEPVLIQRGLIDIGACELDPYADCYRIPAAKAFSGEALGGEFRLSGEIQRQGLIPGEASLDLTASALSFRVQNELTLTFSSDLSFYAGDLLKPGSYAIGGSVDVTEGRYYKDYDIQSDLLQERLVGQVLETRRRDEQHEQDIFKQIPELQDIGLDLSLTCENGFSVDNEVAGAALNIDLVFHIDLTGTLGEPNIMGVIDVRDGKVNFRGTDFEIMSGGQLTFKGDTDAAIELTAQAEINTQSSFTSTVVGTSASDRRKRIRTSELAEGSQDYVITLSLSGTLSAPTWDLDSRPFLTDNNIYTLIFTGKTLEELSAGNNDSPAVDIAVESIIAPFFEAQLDEILSAEQFKFLFSEGAAQFVYIQQVNRALRLAAGVSIRGAEGNEQAISAEYRFDDSWLFELTLQNTIEEEGKAPVSRVGGRLQWRIPLD